MPIPSSGKQSGDSGHVSDHNDVADTLTDHQARIVVLEGTAEAGPAGPSAYDVAVTEGFAGTEAEWLESLRGVDGSTGPSGTGMPQVYYSSATGWPARPVSADPVKWKSLLNSDAPAPTGATEGDEWERRV